MKKEYDFYSKPFSHQEHEFFHSRDKRHYAILWEQGTGKTKLTCDNFSYLSEQEEIDGVLVVAPNGVHRNWVTDEIPKHCDPSLGIRTFLWNSSKSGNKDFAKEFDSFLDHPALAVFAINYDALITERGYKACERFLKNRTAMMVCDESHRIKTPGAKRTKKAIILGRLAKYKRILSGTAVGNSPFDVFSQFSFLDPDILGYKSFYVFKNRFGIFEQQFAGRNKFMKLVQYKNLDELQALIKGHSSRVTKDEVLDLPDKLYTKRYFSMSPEQTRIYEDLRETYMVELATGESLTASLALVRMLRLQQITCGYLPIDGDMIRIDGTKNTRLSCLLDLLEDYEGQKVIIWARFTEDIRQILEALPKGSAVHYYGGTTEDERKQAVCKFQEDSGITYFVANPQAAGEGLTLTAAKVAVYYSNSFKLLERLQSEDRCHRIGQMNHVTYVDIIAPGTVDERIVSALRDKKNLASLINGDTLKEWI